MRLETDWLTGPAISRVMAALEGGGKQALFVGGCVRNALLLAGTTDIDIATDALPEETMKLLEGAGLRAVPTGIDHGTITAVADGQGFEITTFRKDVETDGRRAVVAFSDRIEDDARRRDFTMNALYARADGTVIDPLGGLPDLLARRVRFIEDPTQRIAEDYLRILRFFRFHAWYGDPDGGMDAEALAAISDAIEGIDTLSKERIGAEMKKLLSAPDPVQATAAMEQSGALSRVLPGATTRLLGPVVMLEAQVGLRPDWLRRLLALGGTDQAALLRLSKAEARRLAEFDKSAGLSIDEAAYRFGADTGWDLALTTAAAMQTPLAPDLADHISQAASAQMPVAAADLAPLSGKALGQRLRALETAWIASGFALTKAELLNLP